VFADSEVVQAGVQTVWPAAAAPCMTSGATAATMPAPMAWDIEREKCQDICFAPPFYGLSDGLPHR
jgi:hypothetical protein